MIPHEVERKLEYRVGNSTGFVVGVTLFQSCRKKVAGKSDRLVILGHKVLLAAPKTLGLFDLRRTVGVSCSASTWSACSSTPDLSSRLTVPCSPPLEAAI